jgi:23S rRNA pseudouridine1911/1915/1917 synthase
MRLDQFVVSRLEGISRARVQQLMERKKIEVDGRAEKPSYRIEGGEVVRLLAPPTPRPLNAEPEDIPLDVVFEDDAIAVVNKPAGMTVHAGAGQSASEDMDDDDVDGRATVKDPRTHGTLVNALLFRFAKLSKHGGDLRPGIVHRLDKDTSGLIVIAKSDKAHRKLAEQFSGRTVKKKYIALVHGWPKNDQGTINAPVGRDRSRRHRMATGGVGARDAVSHYTVLKRISSPYGKFALLEVTIETGRTHQIRVHLASIGHTVVGDTLYGAPREFAPLPSAYLRAKKPANTKATRDRAVSDLARALTLEAMGESPTSSKSSARKTSAKSKAKPAALGAKPESLNRNFLHAATLEFAHPVTGKPVRFERKLPNELQQFLRTLVHSD